MFYRKKLVFQVAKNGQNKQIGYLHPQEGQNYPVKGLAEEEGTRMETNGSRMERS